jgi:hypothetical protein
VPGQFIRKRAIRMIKTRLDPVKEGRLHFLFEYLAQLGPKFKVSIPNFVISCLGRIVKETISHTDKKEKKNFPHI